MTGVHPKRKFFTLTKEQVHTIVTDEAHLEQIMDREDLIPKTFLLEERLVEAVEEGQTLGELFSLIRDTKAEINAGAPL